jgi:glycosyltransferase involved in cell wall biosynthesis
VLVVGLLGKSARLLKTWETLTGRTQATALEAGSASIPWSDVRLVAVGERTRAYDGSGRVIQVGFVSEADLWALLRGAVALVNPSLYESLSLVLMEAWTVCLPVIVDERCDVTAEHVRASGGGIAVDFRRPSEAAFAISRAFGREADRRAMGACGAAYATRSCDWNRVLDVYERVARA